MELTTIYYSKADLLDFIEGATFLATGGGGSKVIAKKLLNKSQIRSVKGISITNIPEDFPIAMVAQVFAPSAIWNNLDYDSALNSFCSLLPTSGGVLLGEIGAVNGIVPAIVAAKTNNYLVTSSQVDRSTPEMDIGLFQCHVPLKELHLVSKDKTVTKIFDYGNTTDAMKAERDILQVLQKQEYEDVFEGVGGFATYPMTGRALRIYAKAGYVFEDTFEYARKLGNAMRQMNVESRLLEIVQHHIGPAYKPYVLFKGFLVDCVLHPYAQDYGYVDFRSLTPETLAGLRIYYSNENIIAYTTEWKDTSLTHCEEKNPVAIGPDAISYLLLQSSEDNQDYKAGYSLSNDAFDKDTHGYPDFFKRNPIAIIGIPEPRLRTTEIIASCKREITRARQAFGKSYTGEYIPIEDLHVT